MDITGSFYLLVVGSIPAEGTKIKDIEVAQYILFWDYSSVGRAVDF